MSICIRSKVLKFSVAGFMKNNYSSSSNLVNVTKNGEGTSILSMERAPVNSLNLELLSELRKALENAQKDGSKGVILTSSLPTIFSAGLDIMEMYKPDMKRAKQFWEELQQTWLTLYSLGVPTAAAINGASPAGGCLMAMSCEYRVFAEGKHEIGLNETKLGIVAPSWFKDVYVATIGYRRAELALLQGAQFSPQRALEIGLVDELASNKEDAIVKCQKYIDSFARIPAPPRQITKMSLREEVINRFKKIRDNDSNVFLEYISDPQIQKGLNFYIQSLKKKN